MFIAIINDCKSQNDIGRQKTRYATLFPEVSSCFVGIDSNLEANSTIEGAGNLIDLLDASNGAKGVIALNVAPRGQVKEDGHNGSLFCYFYYKETLIISTVKGFNLSLVKKLGIVNSVHVLDTDAVMNYLSSTKVVTKILADKIKDTQFRSFEFQPRVAKWLLDGLELPFKSMDISNIPDIPNSIGCIDSFGNAKTTLVKNDLPSKLTSYKINELELKYYERLKDVPDGETALYSGSSGLGNIRFLEIATQNRSESAAKSLKLSVGDTIEFNAN